MLNRIANVVTFLTFGLLSAILLLGAVAVHDFNNPADSRIFVREFDGKAYFETEDRQLAYVIDYKTCGHGSYTGFENGLLEASAPTYGTFVSDYVTPSGVSSKRFTPLSSEVAWTMSVQQRTDFQLSGSTATGSRRVCKINPTGIWTVSRGLISKLI